jgi:hypothetical protein
MEEEYGRPRIPILLSTETTKSLRAANMVYPNPSKGISRLRFNNANHNTVDISILMELEDLYTAKNVKSDEEFGQKMLLELYLKAESKGQIVYSGNFW